MEYFLCFLLTVLGCMVGIYKKEYLVYGLLLLLPLYEVGMVSFITLKMSEIIKYTFAIPMTVVLVLMFLQKKIKLKTVANIYIFTFVFIIYLVIPVLLSKNTMLTVLIPLLLLQFVVFLYIIETYKLINIKVILNIIKWLIFTQFVIATMQFLGEGNIILRNIFALSGFNQIPVGAYFRATGTLIDPNYFALYISVLSGALYKLEYSKIKKFIFLSLGILCVVMSLSRMGLVLVAVLLMLIYLDLNKRAFIRSHIFLLSLIILSLVVAVTPVGEAILNAFNTRLNEDTSLSASPRVMILVVFFTKILSFTNFIFGIGFESFSNYVYPYLGHSYTAHNQYIQILADVGFIGLFIILLFISYIYKIAKRSKIKNNSFSFVIIILLVGSLFLTITYELYISIFLGLFISQYVYEKREHISLKGEVYE